jgi:hypothetical protein
VRTPIETATIAQSGRQSRGCRARTSWLALLLVTLVGCGEPSVRELKNRRELEALLTAIALKNKTELERDVKRIEDRHDSGELSDEGYKDLEAIIKKARSGDWAGAEKQAYELRESKPYFQ